jgi:hypothetical protein
MEEVRLIDANALHERIAMNLRASNPFTIEECCYKDALNSVDGAPTIDPESLRPTAKWIAVRLMADGAECKCGNCGRHETFTSFDRHTDHVYCCRCGYKMEGLTNE